MLLRATRRRLQTFLFRDLFQPTQPALFLLNLGIRPRETGVPFRSKPLLFHTRLLLDGRPDVSQRSLTIFDRPVEVGESAFSQIPDTGKVFLDPQPSFSSTSCLSES